MRPKRILDMSPRPVLDGYKALHFLIHESRTESSQTKVRLNVGKRLGGVCVTGCGEYIAAAASLSRKTNAPDH